MLQTIALRIEGKGLFEIISYYRGWFGYFSDVSSDLICHSQKLIYWKDIT